VDCDYEVVVKKFYPYISDLSFVSAPKGEVLETIKGNMPALNRKTFLPLEDMQKLSLPVVNIGPFGEDAHKFTESLLKKYSFEVAPDLLYKTILNLLE
jgi:arginine utilization protein RocB